MPEQPAGNRDVPSYPIIARLLRQGSVIPFLGAGVNTRPDPAEEWKPGAPYLPRASELSRHLVREFVIPARGDRELDDLPKVSSYGAEKSGRNELRNVLREVFARDYAPCAIHDYLASLPEPLLIVTTNYDDLTEQAFARAKRDYHLVVHPTDRKDAQVAILWWEPGAREPVVAAANTLPLQPGSETIIYKMHGSIIRPPRTGGGAGDVGTLPLDGRAAQHDSFVITEDDYVDFLSRMILNTAIPVRFVPYFHATSFLFLGYGLNDWNLRVMLRNLESVLGGGDGGRAWQPDKRSWAIQFGPSPLDEALWRRRGVLIYDMDIDDFVKKLRALDGRGNHAG